MGDAFFLMYLTRDFTPTQMAQLAGMMVLFTVGLAFVVKAGEAFAKWIKNGGRK